MELKFGVAYNQDSCSSCIPSRNSAGGSGGSGGGSTGPVDWDSIAYKPNSIEYEWKVGDATYPLDGESDFVRTDFANVPIGRINVIRGGLTQNKRDMGIGGTWITKASVGDNKITFHPALTSEEPILVTISPL